MLPQLNSACKSALYDPRNIFRKRKFPSLKTTEILVHVFVSSKLDHCNSLLYNVPKYVVKKLQSVQNAAARLITCSRKHDHITAPQFCLISTGILLLSSLNSRFYCSLSRLYTNSPPPKNQDFVTSRLELSGNLPHYA